jgi:hypothetical protein
VYLAIIIVFIHTKKLGSFQDASTIVTARPERPRAAGDENA